MSSGPVGKVLEHYPGAGNELLLAIVIADEAARCGTFRLLVKDLARLSRQTEQNVRRLIRKMEDMGWLLCTEKGGGRGNASEYCINQDWLRQPLGWLPKPEKPENHEHPDVRVSEPKPELNVRVFSDPPSSLKTLPPVVPHRGGSAEPSATPKIEPDPKDLELARWMLGLIRELHPRHREPNWKRWCRAIQAMQAIDGHTRHDIAALFKRANADRTPRPGGTFCWCKVILSPDKLRAQWDKLTIEFGKPPPPKEQDRLCHDCKKRVATIRQKGQPQRCGECADIAERAAA